MIDSTDFQQNCTRIEQEFQPSIRFRSRLYWKLEPTLNWHRSAAYDWSYLKTDDFGHIGWFISYRRVQGPDPTRGVQSKLIRICAHRKFLLDQMKRSRNMQSRKVAFWTSSFTGLPQNIHGKSKVRSFSKRIAPYFVKLLFHCFLTNHSVLRQNGLGFGLSSRNYLWKNASRACRFSLVSGWPVEFRTKLSPYSGSRGLIT